MNDLKKDDSQKNLNDSSDNNGMPVGRLLLALALVGVCFTTMVILKFVFKVF